MWKRAVWVFFRHVCHTKICWVNAAYVHIETLVILRSCFFVSTVNIYYPARVNRFINTGFINNLHFEHSKAPSRVICLSSISHHYLIQLTTRWWSVYHSALIFTQDLSKTWGCRSDNIIIKSIISLLLSVLVPHSLINTLNVVWLTHKSLGFRLGRPLLPVTSLQVTLRLPT